MNRKKSILSTAVIALLLALATISGTWGLTFASGTLPTIGPTRTATVQGQPTGTPNPSPTSPSGPSQTAVSTNAGTQPATELTTTLTTTLAAEETSTLVWFPMATYSAYVDYSSLSAPDFLLTKADGALVNGAGEVNLAINHTQWAGFKAADCSSYPSANVELREWDQKFAPQPSQVNFYRPLLEVYFSTGPWRIDVTCQHSVSFDLTGFERFNYNNYKDRFAFLWYNPQLYAWDTCPDLTFDETQGLFGRLSCKTTKTGYFTLGWFTKADQ